MGNTYISRDTAFHEPVDASSDLLPVDDPDGEGYTVSYKCARCGYDFNTGIKATIDRHSVEDCVFVIAQRIYFFGEKFAKR